MIVIQLMKLIIKMKIMFRIIIKKLIDFKIINLKNLSTLNIKIKMKWNKLMNYKKNTKITHKFYQKIKKTKYNLNPLISQF